LTVVRVGHAKNKPNFLWLYAWPDRKDKSDELFYFDENTLSLQSADGAIRVVLMSDWTN
jgi:hypothetical protein